MYVSAVLSWAIFGYTPTWTGWFLQISWDRYIQRSQLFGEKLQMFLKVFGFFGFFDYWLLLQPCWCFLGSFPMGKTVACRNFLSGMALVTVAMVRGLDRCLNGLVVKKPWEVTKIWGFHDGKWGFLHWKWWFMDEKLGKWSIEDGDLTLKVEISLPRIGVLTVYKTITMGDWKNKMVIQPNHLGSKWVLVKIGICLDRTLIIFRIWNRMKPCLLIW